MVPKYEKLKCLQGVDLESMALAGCNIKHPYLTGFLSLLPFHEVFTETSTNIKKQPFSFFFLISDLLVSLAGPPRQNSCNNQ